MHATAYGGCSDIVRESSLKVENPLPHRGLESEVAGCAWLFGPKETRHGQHAKQCDPKYVSE